MLTTDNMISYDEGFGIPYYEYDQSYSGSFKGMRFDIRRDPLGDALGELARSKDPHKHDDATFMVTVYPEPFCFECTDERYKVVKYFPFTEEGRKQVIDWLNDMYIKGDFKQFARETF